MNQREKILAAAVFLGLVLFVVSRFLPEDFLSGDAFAGGDLESARRTFRDYTEWIDRSPEINANYRRVEVQLPETVGVQTPESTFTNQLNNILKNRGWASPSIGAHKRSSIKGIDDYEYIDLQFSAIGEPQRVVQLLTELQNNGLLIKTFSLRQNRPEEGVVTLDGVVSRLVKLTEDEKRRIAQRRRR
jgi:hypothetical protein